MVNAHSVLLFSMVAFWQIETKGSLQNVAMMCMLAPVEQNYTVIIREEC
jgi:hypothetical protein